MSDVWYAIPTANAAKARTCFEAWRKMGYMTAAIATAETNAGEGTGADLTVGRIGYPGYPNCVNRLCKRLVSLHGAELIVTGGDDILPDPNKPAGEIAAEFWCHFPDGMGVMEPTGDRWMTDGRGRAASERICGSPWMGKAFIQRINGGAGPFWGEYFHFFCDEEMCEVARAQNILWQRPDLTHFHDHWSRNRRSGRRPDYLQEPHDHCVKDKCIFERRKAAGFPGSAPIAVEERK